MPVVSRGVCIMSPYSNRNSGTNYLQQTPMYLAVTACFIVHQKGVSLVQVVYFAQGCRHSLCYNCNFN